MKLFFYMFIFALILCHPFRAQSMAYPLFNQWHEFSKSSKVQLLHRWMKTAAEEILTGKKNTVARIKKNPPFFGSLGIFITLKKGSTVRGCFGSFHPTTDDLYFVLFQYIKGALKQDHRSEPLDRSELHDIQIILTIARQPQNVQNIYTIDLETNGVVVITPGGAQQVIVPAEYKTTEYLINKHKAEKCSFMIFETVTIRP